MHKKRHSIKLVSDLTGFRPSTLRRYEADYGYIFMPERVQVGDKCYRIYVWKHIEMLLYVKQKLKEGYAPKQAWDSFFEFSIERIGTAEQMDEEVYYLNPELEYWVSDDEMSQGPLN
jgi:hypothetical protein